MSDAYKEPCPRCGAVPELQHSDSYTFINPRLYRVRCRCTAGGVRHSMREAFEVYLEARKEKEE